MFLVSKYVLNGHLIEKLITPSCISGLLPRTKTLPPSQTDRCG